MPRTRGTRRARAFRPTKEKGRARVLATSFVVTFSAASVTEACKKESVDPKMESTSASVYRQVDGNCYRSQSTSCPKGVSCNPPPPIQVDCPPKLRDGGEAPATTRRPPGKEDWLRVTPSLAYVNAALGCIYTPEWFCSPAESKHTECTPYPESVKVSCSLDADAGKRHFDAFVFKDGVGTCHEIAAGECAATFNGKCDVGDGEVVPCLREPSIPAAK